MDRRNCGNYTRTVPVWPGKFPRSPHITSGMKKPHVRVLSEICKTLGRTCAPPPGHTQLVRERKADDQAPPREAKM